MFRVTGLRSKVKWGKKYAHAQLPLYMIVVTKFEKAAIYTVTEMVQTRIYNLGIEHTEAFESYLYTLFGLCWMNELMNEWCLTALSTSQVISGNPTDEGNEWCDETPPWTLPTVLLSLSVVFLHLFTYCPVVTVVFSHPSYLFKVTTELLQNSLTFPWFLLKTQISLTIFPIFSLTCGDPAPGFIRSPLCIFS